MHGSLINVNICCNCFVILDLFKTYRSLNSSNLILQNILFIIFIILIFILVKSDDILKYFGYGFDYTNIYGSLYDYLSSFDEESGSNLSNSEKLKLLYRTDILSMIIFIFTGFLVLIL